MVSYSAVVKDILSCHDFLLLLMHLCILFNLDLSWWKFPHLKH